MQKHDTGMNVGLGTRYCCKNLLYLRWFFLHHCWKWPFFFFFLVI